MKALVEVFVERAESLKSRISISGNETRLSELDRITTRLLNAGVITEAEAKEIQDKIDE